MDPLHHVPAGVPACAVVDLAAITDNVARLRGYAGQAEVMAVVKADGYGHGLVPAARAALAGGATWLGVAYLAEALALRAAGVAGPLLAWITVPGDRFAEAVAADVQIGAGAGWVLDEIAEAAQATGRPARVHLKVDTGLGRGGASAAQWPQLVDRALKLQADGVLEVVGLFSHLACADSPADTSVAGQVAAFTGAVAFAQARGARPQVRHLANSAATIAIPDARFDVVRPGIAVYGLSPIPDRAASADLGLRPAMTLAARIALVKPVPAGHGVSYGLTYRTGTDTRLALVPVGYADGLPRHASGRGPVLLGGRRYRIAGRVCMDQVVVDLGTPVDSGLGSDVRNIYDHHTDAGPEPGDLAVLFGTGAAGEPTAQDWADAADTISYEIVTRIGARVQRVYAPGDDRAGEPD